MTQETPNEVQKIEPPEEAQTLISGLLPLVDSEYKIFAVDIYAIQLANCRNYLWMFFIVISASLAFFKESRLGDSCLAFIHGYPVSPFFIPTMIFLILAIGCSVYGFWLGVNISTGTEFCEPHFGLQNRLTDLEYSQFNQSDIYSLKRDMLDGLCGALENGLAQMERRAKDLILLAKLFKVTLISFLITILFYGGSYLR